MTDENAEENESGFARFLDAVDSKSRTLEKKVRRSPKKEVQDVVETGVSIETRASVTNESKFSRFIDSIDSKSRSLEKKVRRSPDRRTSPEVISQNGEYVTDEARGLRTGVVLEKLSDISNTTVLISRRVFSHLPYIIPATVILQMALWIGYLEEGTLANNIVSQYADGMGGTGRSIVILVSIFGIIGAYLVTMGFEPGIGDQILSSEVIDVMVILLVISSVLYIMKRFQSLYYLALVFIGSVILRSIESGNNVSIALLALSTVGLLGFYSSISLVMINRRKDTLGKEVGIYVDYQEISGKVDGEPEYSNEHASEVWLEYTMDQAPVTKPTRPSRRSEYELYEWVLLLANLIMWPAVIILSVVIGAGDMIDGRSYNLEENYLMLLGPLSLTLFFFIMLYRMDANARDGSLYAAEKKSYLSEMEKYLEARTAYLELVKLQAENKKMELVTKTSEE